ncbi:MAG: drug/metabolite transporter (DMT)-like permease [Planctomycetota bacterium]|jgi:drug/metabolite transporter (DMT)-like permease
MANSTTSKVEAPTSTRVALVLTLGVLGVSTGAILVRTADCSPLAKAAYRCALAAIALGLAGGWRPAPPTPGEQRDPGYRRALALAILAGAFLAFHFGTWIASLDHTSVATSSVLVATTPVWVAIAAPFLTSDRPSLRALCGVGLSLLGAIWIALDGGGVGSELLGAGLAVAGAVGAAGYVLIGRRVGHRIPMGHYLFLCYGSAAVLLVCATLLNGDELIGFDRRTWMALVGLAVFPQLIGHSACNWSLRWMPALLVSVVFLAEPILASIFAWGFLGEAPGRVVLYAAPLVFLGILLAADRKQ